MPAAALGNGQSIVQCTDGVRATECAWDDDGNPIAWHWDAPVVSASDTCSSDVIIEGYGIVRKDDTMAPHCDGVPCTPACITHTPAIDTYSSTVFVNGREVAGLGNTYNKNHPFNHTITTGASTVFIG